MKATIAIALSLLCACGFSPAGDAPDAGGAGAGDVGSPDARASLPDASGAGAADASPGLVTLRETASDVAVAGHSDACIEAAGTITRAQTYARVFPLASFAQLGGAALEVTAVSFAYSATHAPGITIALGTYAGPLGATSLNSAQITWITTEGIDPPDSPGQAAATVTAPIAAAPTVAGDAVLVVAIASPDYASDAGTFSVAGTSGAQSAPSYYQAAACATPSLSTRDGRNNANVGTFVVTVTGYAK
jgi:hypothetical protein